MTRLDFTVRVYFTVYRTAPHLTAPNRTVTGDTGQRAVVRALPGVYGRTEVDGAVRGSCFVVCRQCSVQAFMVEQKSVELLEVVVL